MGGLLAPQMLRPPLSRPAHVLVSARAAFQRFCSPILGRVLASRARLNVLKRRRSDTMFPIEAFTVHDRCMCALGLVAILLPLLHSHSARSSHRAFRSYIPHLIISPHLCQRPGLRRDLVGVRAGYRAAQSHPLSHGIRSGRARVIRPLRCSIEFMRNEVICMQAEIRDPTH